MTRAALLFLAALWLGAAHAEPVRIVAFGGSNTYGKNLKRSEAYPAQLEAMLKAAGYDVVIKNEGVNGMTTSEELDNIGSAVPEGTRIVILQPGGNDVIKKSKAWQANDSEANIRKIVQRLLDRKILVLLSGTMPQREYVKDMGVRTVGSIHRMALDHMQNDGLHLTPEGYRIVAEKMFPIVKRFVEQVSAEAPQSGR